MIAQGTSHENRHLLHHLRMPGVPVWIHNRGRGHYMLKKGDTRMRFTNRTIKDNRVEFNIDDGLDQDLFRYCEDMCMENCASTFDPKCGDCHVTRLYYAMMRLAEDEYIEPPKQLEFFMEAWL